MIGVMSLSKFFQRFSYLLPDAELTASNKPMPAAPATDEAFKIAIAIATARRR
jgi:hypothetical protein